MLQRDRQQWLLKMLLRNEFPISLQDHDSAIALERIAFIGKQHQQKLFCAHSLEVYGGSAIIP